MSSPAATLTVVVLAGGRSSEHEVSLASGAAVREGLIAGGHEVIAVEIGRDGRWLREGATLAVRPGEGLLGADVVFPALHGPFGEDGTIQGMLDTLGVPYVGAGVAASALCIDKVRFKTLMGAAGLPQVAFVGVRRPRWEAQRELVLEQLAALGWPLFVKPAHLGSSVGVARVAAPPALPAALEGAFAHDELVIAEATGAGVEVECGVLGLARADGVRADGPRSDALASEPGEISFAGELYDYGAKYEPGGMQLIVPARISSTARARVMELSLQAFAYSGCEGLARVDFFVDGERVLVNELNTMPGFTATSVYAKLLEASGVPYPELLDRLCRLAIERHRAGALLRH